MSQLPSKKAPEGAREVENFFGVYLLYCTNPKYKGRTYIGKTTDPNRRIFQHNKGKQAGGAWRTSNKGPWDMVLIVHGFPNDISALRFEWAWQHPSRSRRLNALPPKKKSEKTIRHLLRLMLNMLNLGPWNRLPLTLRWLKPEYQAELPGDAMEPPLHMPVVQGPVKSSKVGSRQDVDGEMQADAGDAKCVLCCKPVSSSQMMSCLYPECKASSHLLCLGNHFLCEEGGGGLLPVQGGCPVCKQQQAWGDLVRRKKGCCDYLNGDEEE